MSFKLDLKDKKILDLLGENSRFSNSQIAKKVGLSKPAIEYRLKRFKKNKSIQSYYTIINFTKLGYSQYKVYFKFQNTSLEEENKILEYWVKEKNSVWVGQTRGKWDLAVSILAKNNYEFGKILSDFLNKFSKFILEKDVLLTEYSPIYQRRYLENKSNKEFIYGVPEKIYSLDEKDKLILKELSSNSRIPIIDLAEKTKLTRDILNYRMKKLKKDEIIFQYSVFPNLENIGIKIYKLILRTKNFDEEEEKKMKSYINSNKKINQFLKLIGAWDLEIEIEAESEDEFYEVVNEMRKKFSEIIRDFDILRIIKTHKLNFFPF